MESTSLSFDELVAARHASSTLWDSLEQTETWQKARAMEEARLLLEKEIGTQADQIVRVLYQYYPPDQARQRLYALIEALQRRIK